MSDRCFMLRKKGNCGALSVESCPGWGKCVFYKRRRDYERDLKTANARLCLLPEKVQLKIAEKYHGGRMPWRGVRV